MQIVPIAMNVHVNLLPVRFNAMMSTNQSKSHYQVPIHMRLQTVFLLFSLLLCFPSPAAQFATDESATYDYASHAALVRWPLDLSKISEEKDHVALVGSTFVKDEDRERPVLISLSSLDLQQNNLLFLLKSANRGKISFFSKESKALKEATLTLHADSGPLYLSPTLDTSLNAGSRLPQGDQEYIRVTSSQIGLLAFSLPEAQRQQAISKAELLIHLTAKQFADSQLEVYQLNQVVKPAKEVRPGIAAKYPDDINIETDAQVFHAENFDKQDLLAPLMSWLGKQQSAWRNVSKYERVPHHLLNHYANTEGYAAKAHFRTNKHMALNMDYYFADNLSKEPEEVYLRYYLKLEKGADFAEGGKLPGFGGTYGRAGWGGRANDGYNGWSARGTFFNTLPKDHPHWPSSMPIGSYFYEAGQDNKYGDRVSWGHQNSVLSPGQWHCIEQRIKLNSPGQQDGIFEAWVDGVQVYQRHNLNMRFSDALKIEKVWMNFYYGGAELPDKSFNMYLDNIVIASAYIGPIKKGPKGP
ncbi:hypothetical protein P2G88_03520 [Aliiglaciecola sp. CAU 1673]|nr:hypothetical protein [Aliiglaciecola sp. CAU 1673]